MEAKSDFLVLSEEDKQCLAESSAEACVFMGQKPEHVILAVKHFKKKKEKLRAAEVMVIAERIKKKGGELPLEPPRSGNLGDEDNEDNEAVPSLLVNAGKKENEAVQNRLLLLRAENIRLKAWKMCKACKTNPASITLLPCGHFAYCRECGRQFHACPLCKKTILADVYTLM